MDSRRRQQRHAGRRVGALVTCVLLLAGCSSTDKLLGSVGLGSSSQGQPSGLVGTPRVQPASAAAAPPGSPDPDIDCPGIDIRQGASTLTIAGKGADNPGLDLRYQGTIARAARECKILGTSMNVKVGVEGRIILGPAGGPGKVEVPLRYAVVKEGVNPETVATTFHRITVEIPPGSTNVPFTHVEQELTFPIPPGNDIQTYIVYIGFDPNFQEPKARKKPAPRSRKR